jgi:hypothetical protein
MHKQAAHLQCIACIASVALNSDVNDCAGPRRREMLRLSTRLTLKFQVTSPSQVGQADLRYFHTGCVLGPFTSTFSCSSQARSTNSL